MVKKIRFINKYIFALSGWYLFCYILLQASGLFGPSVYGLMQLLHQWPVLSGVGVLMGATIAELWMACKTGAFRDSSRKALAVFYAGLLLTGAGIFVSSLTRFEGSLILNEGQGSNTASSAPDLIRLYVRKFSRPPSADIAMVEVAPFPEEAGCKTRQHQARLLVRDGRSWGKELRVNDAFPVLSNGYYYKVGRVGYSPHVRFFRQGGDIVDDAYAVMNIYPPGKEDSFRTTMLPYTFYLRYYPDASGVPGKAGAFAGRKGPLYKVRIARNLDLVHNGYAEPGELVSADDVLVSFGDVKRWAEIQIVWDPGLYLMIPGLLMAAAGGIAFIMQRNKNARYKVETNG
ncbi:MAG: hypothetical protein M0024_11265 [Nitrospiraceae bacterium]|nr:hypothetical protein [Nitrospiraceae bacterium]